MAMRVLVATDLSAAGDEAIRQASKLVGADGALAAVHVLPYLQAVSTLFPQAHAEEAVNESQITERVANAVGERVAAIAKREAEIFVDQGTDYAEIVRRAEVWKAEVVVLGSHGHSGLSRVLGGVAERVVRHVHCRALIARASAPLGCVLAATDLSEPSLPAVVAAVTEARRLGVALKVANAVDYPQLEAFEVLGLGTPTTVDPAKLRDTARHRLSTMMESAGVTAEGLVLEGPASEVIVAEAIRLGAGLIVVGSRGWSGFSRLMLGSVAEEILRTAPCSVLVVRTAQ
jgi:nucleotide-binding universal stress UspA family protein